MFLLRQSQKTVLLEFNNRNRVKIFSAVPFPGKKFGSNTTGLPSETICDEAEVRDVPNCCLISGYFSCYSIYYDELWMEVRDIVQETGIKTIPTEKKCKKAKWLSEEVLQIAVKRSRVFEGEMA